MDALTPRTIQLLGIEFNNASLPDVCQRLLNRPEGARFGYVVTPNADHIERLRKIPRLRMVYRAAMLCLLDSQLIGNFAAYLGLARPAVITGADLSVALLPRLAGVRVAVVGLDEAGFAALCQRYPDVGFLHHAPPLDLLHNAKAFAAARDFIVHSQCPFSFIALGSPLQELLAYAVAQTREAVGVGLCVGAALEFCSGTRRRAPRWMRKRGLEWMYRLAQEPARLAGRYLVADPKVVVALAMDAVRQKAGGA